jgi:type IV pilus assembly protein PilW
MSDYCFSCFQTSDPTGGTKQGGVSLVELMVAMTIGLILLTAIGSIFLSSKQTARVGDNLSRMQENGRFAIDLLGKNIRVAGYTKISFAPPALFGNAPSPTSFSGKALSNDIVTGSKAGSNSITISYDSDIDCLGAVAPGGRATNAFFINVNNQLMCSSNGASEVLLDGVEDMQILYGVLTGLNTSYLIAPNANASTVVRLCLLFKTTDTSGTTQAQTYLDCNGATTTAGTSDRYIRHAYATTINVRDLTP